MTDLVRHEVHLIAAHPNIRRAVFPSKIWNSIALGRRLVCTGFAGEMLTELEAAKEVRFDQHLDQWTQLILGLDAGVESVPEPLVAPRCGATTELTPAALG
jgi:hypothetical protein